MQIAVTNRAGARAFRKLRTDAGLSQQQVADRLSGYGVSIKGRSAVCKLEDGGTDRLSVWRAYAEIFHISVDSLEAMDRELSLSTL